MCASPILIECPDCEGAGEHILADGYDRYGAPMEKGVRCDECEGTGKVLGKGWPIEMADLEWGASL